MVNWLPERSSHSTIVQKTVWEITPFYTRYVNRRKCLVRGEIPKDLAEVKRVTARQWRMYESRIHRNNPILIGLRYLKLFEQESVNSYSQAAAIVGCSRIRVYQLVSLVTKLSPQIVDYLVEHNQDPVIRRTFTERRLRPLTRIESEDEQLAQFQEMLS